ncbi:DUF1405 domain-containing protein [Bacillaceae bacterium S4-13-58]
MNRSFLWLLWITNLVGTLYGYYWYMDQLKRTPMEFLLFVPDSPTASLFFVFVLTAFLLKKHFPYMEALALVSLLKYGIWAVVMNLLTLFVSGSLHWTGYMLIASHGAMAIQGILYSPYYRIKIRHLVVASLWVLHNEIIDYVFHMMPVYGSLSHYMDEIGYFTFWLSVACIALAYALTVRKTMIHQYRFFH